MFGLMMKSKHESILLKNKQEDKQEIDRLQEKIKDLVNRNFDLSITMAKIEIERLDSKR